VVDLKKPHPSAQDRRLAVYTLISRTTTKLSTRNANATAALVRDGKQAAATARKPILAALLRSLSTWAA
jgi:hypothetical protein